MREVKLVVLSSVMRIGKSSTQKGHEKYLDSTEGKKRRALIELRSGANWRRIREEKKELNGGR